MQGQIPLILPWVVAHVQTILSSLHTVLLQHEAHSPTTSYWQAGHKHQKLMQQNKTIDQAI